MRLAIDTGGTFTDCVYLQAGRPQLLKLLSTPRDPAQAILTAINRLAPGAGAEVRHGTTVGTNALLERTGARVAFVTTAGFEDVIAIGRQARARLYDWALPASQPLATAELRWGVAERTLADGTVLKPVSPEALRALVAAVGAARPESIAVSLLFSFANPANERAVRAALTPLGLPISVSHEILPEFREYERGSTVLVNGYLAPKLGRYLQRLEQSLDAASSGARLHVMQSSGGIIAAGVAAREPVRTILSGPAGGVVGAYAVARAAGFQRMVSFDMGGTSTDVALVDEAGLRITNESTVTGLPVAVPMLDIHTVGAGGGSLASFDGGGALRVGPESAGAEPGPACYGRGEQPTVTDANLVLGRLDAGHFWGGGMILDEARARAALSRLRGPLRDLETLAEGIVRLAEAAMERALRAISIERGRDPRDFTLVSFGGAGPLHACALAAALRLPRVLVPRLPGGLSALGILTSDVVKDYSRTVMLPMARARQAETHFRAMERLGRRELRASGLQALAERALDVRYVGQGYEINLPWGAGCAARFHRAHRQRYGYADETRPIEIVNARVRMVAATPPLPAVAQRRQKGDGRQALTAVKPVRWDGRRVSTRVFDRALLRAGDRFAGPAIVTEYSATTVLPPQWRLHVDARENLVLEPA